MRRPVTLRTTEESSRGGRYPFLKQLSTGGVCVPVAPKRSHLVAFDGGGIMKLALAVTVHGRSGSRATVVR